jgi:hypothetical protein
MPNRFFAVLLYVVQTVVVEPRRISIVYNRQFCLFSRYCLVRGHCFNCLNQVQYPCLDRGTVSHSGTLFDTLLCSFYEMLNLNIHRPSAFLRNFRSSNIHRDYK